MTHRELARATSVDRINLGQNAKIDPGVILGYEYEEDAGRLVIGDDARIRTGTIIYADVTIGRGLMTGHGALIRESTSIGENSKLGTNVVVDGHATIGSSVSIQTGAYIPPETIIGDRVFLGPNAVLTNDPYPLRTDEELAGPTIYDDVSIGANATILPDVTLGEMSFIGAGAVVTEDVPSRTLAKGAPAKPSPLPDSLAVRNELR